MDKEEIIRENSVWFECAQEDLLTVRRAETAMDEYAKQQAIGFAEWINGEMYECFLHIDENVKFWHDVDGNGNLTTEELYSLYSQNKNL